MTWSVELSLKMIRSGSSIIVLSVAMVYASSGCYDANEGGVVFPDVVTVSDCELHVDETLIIPLELEEPVPDAEWTFESESIPNLDRHARIVETDGHIRFRWTPTAAHVGRHEIFFTVTSGVLSDAMVVNVEVLP